MVSGIYAVMTYQKVPKKPDYVYTMHEIFACLPCMETIALSFLPLR